MKILYLSQKDIDIDGEGIYSDLINGLLAKGYEIVLCCADSRYEKTGVAEERIKKVKIKVPNQFGVNFIKKGLVLLRLEGVIKRAIRKYLKGERFDLVLYATPPITLAGVIAYCKKTFCCKSYLMLKDIFPQNAVDLHMMSTHGATGILYKFFRKKEKKLYVYSDRIGCMSPANVEYLLKHNPYLDKGKVELFSNAIQIRDVKTGAAGKELLEKYRIDKDKLVFIYGGNLGKPQGLDFLAEAIAHCSDLEGVHFVMIGKGGEKERFFRALRNLKNVTALDALPKEEYEKFCAECDVGMVVLDKRFTIPNYPSRILSYLNNAMPVFACTDTSSDVKELVEKQALCGKWCFSGSVQDFKETVRWFLDNRDKLNEMGRNGKQYLIAHFNVEDNIKKLEEFVNSPNQ